MARSARRPATRVQLYKIVAVMGVWFAAYGIFQHFTWNSNFVAGRPSFQPPRPRVALDAEPAASSGGNSVSLVKVTPENTQTTASIVGGLAGLSLGGIWVGAGLFTVVAYLARNGDKDDEVNKAINGASAAGLEAINYVAGINDKYGVTSGIGNAINTSLENAKTGPNKEIATAVSNFFEGSAEAIESVDKEVKIKDSVGAVAISTSELANKAVIKVLDLNKQYKVTDRIKATIEEATSSASSTK